MRGSGQSMSSCHTDTSSMALNICSAITLLTIVLGLGFRPAPTRVPPWPILKTPLSIQDIKLIGFHREPDSVRKARDVESAARLGAGGMTRGKPERMCGA